MITTEIKKYLKSSTRVLEWGSGESTLHFPKFVKKWDSIEHNKEWYNKISSRLLGGLEPPPVEPIHTLIIDSTRVFGTKLKLIEAEVALKYFKDWKNIADHPYWNTDIRRWWLEDIKKKYPNGCDYTYERAYQLQNYVLMPMADLKDEKVDIVIVDGRARSMCAFVAKEILEDDGLVLFDDYFGREQWHSDITTEYEIIERISNLAVMKKIP